LSDHRQTSVNSWYIAHFRYKIYLSSSSAASCITDKNHGRNYDRLGVEPFSLFNPINHKQFISVNSFFESNNKTKTYCSSYSPQLILEFCGGAFRNWHASPEARFPQNWATAELVKQYMRNHHRYEVKKGWMMPRHQRSVANSSGNTSQLSNIDSNEDEDMDKEKDEDWNEKDSIRTNLLNVLVA
jgi:hypothetical protein